MSMFWEEYEVGLAMNEWFTSVDHKKLGIMYFIVALVMLLHGFLDAIMMRTQLAMAAGDAAGYLPTEHYDQIFTAHGVIMIFFVAMPMPIGLMNLVVPLQVGARDVAFPFLKNLSFWLFAVAVILVNISLVVGEFAKTGWLAYAPLSGIELSPGMKVFNWLFTMFRGSLELTSPVLWILGFIITFTLGGMTGVMLAVPVANFVLHNSLFVIAHFHNVIIGGVVFGMMVGLTFRFPKAFGFTLSEKWGKRSFWCWFIGFYIAFMPLYVLAFFGAVRRM